MKVTELNLEEWAGLLNATHSATIFHTNEWLAVLRRTYGCEIHRLGFLDGGDLVGGIPVCLRRKFIYRLAGSPASGMVTPYQGPVCQDLFQYGPVLTAFWCYASSMPWDFVEVTPPPESPLVRWESNDPRIRYESLKTICVDLTQGEMKLFREMEGDCRNQIRQSERRGAECRELNPDQRDWLGPYYQMTTELYRRRGRPPAMPRAFFENLVDEFKGTGKLKLFVATYKEEMIAAGLYLVDNRTFYGLDLVSRQAYQHLRPNNLIEWSSIRWAIQQGLQTYDMVGANIFSIARFKKGFGGHVVPYVTFQRTKDWLASFGECGYRKLAPLARRVAVRLGQ